MSALNSPGRQHDLGQLLSWLVEMGADEVLYEQPVNRFAASTENPPEAPTPHVSTMAKPARNWKAVASGAEAIAAAQALAASITDIRLYAEALENFELHSLRKTASKLCAFSGNSEAAALVFCDKPRNAEDRSGEVLAGDAQLLASRMLAAIGLKAFSGADTVALANFIPWRPPGNRMPTEQEALMLVPFARKLIALLQPKAILCFGHLPGQYLCGGADSTVKARGKWMEMEGRPALTTFHPDTLLKNPSSKPLAWADLQAFRHMLEADS